ncbi:cell division protein ZapE [Hahella sp. CCB-MM4]|uniref:cell division protein ZapE n=1 Tax=Hahella sp. (strain CCB-MM4) TaxID=1926491 RepID=UPI000B9ACE40|nr:cell division protein ZapE [Hahella sp. CCB-MM4]OZG70525.1 cell division protein ZapE [Hahella sp. CCB-MM4]
MTTPLEKYRRDLERADFSYDAAQEMAVKKLQDLFERLIKSEEEQKSKGSLARLASKVTWKKKKSIPERGLYFWGGVGRGKTYLMDTFYESLPFERKMRVHFHRFMQKVHQELKALKGEKNPLELVADRFSQEARIICFDEFFVTDIGDAMILGTLMEALFSRGVSLVCTSNIVPDGLYKDGLQRQRFLPAIALLNEHTEVINVDGGTDYRLRSLEQAELYHFPLDGQANASLEKSYQNLALEDGSHGIQLEVNGRRLNAVKRAEDVVWFEFRELCDGPRSQNDYIELAREFHAVLVSNVPVFKADIEDQARRFINLVDEFYDRRVKMIISAEAAIHEIYRGERLKFEFERTESRLLEMQSREYLASPHRP